MSKILYALNTQADNPTPKVVEQLPSNAIHTVIYEVDEQVFPLKTQDEQMKYLSTLYKDPLHTKVLPGFVTHSFP